MKKKSEQLVKQSELLDLKKDLMEITLSGNVTTPEELAKELNIPLEEVVKITNEPEFVGLLTGYSNSKANMTYHLVGIPKLLEILQSGDNKEILSAIKLLSELTGNKSNKGSETTVNISLENLIKQKENNTVAADVIDAWEVGEDVEEENGETINLEFRKQ